MGAHANVAEASMKLRVLPTERSKKLIKSTPKTPMSSFDLPSSPEMSVASSYPQKVGNIQKRVPPRPAPPLLIPKGQRIKKSVPQFVDERDSKRIARKPLGQAPESVREDRSREFVHHPADVVSAAMTIQRFFKSVKAKKEAAKKARRNDSTTTESSAEDSSVYDPSQSDSSETDTQQRKKSISSKDSSSKDSSESSDTETDEESRKTVRFDSIKRKKLPPKDTEPDLKRHTTDSPKKTMGAKQKQKSSSDSSDSESEKEGKRLNKKDSVRKERKTQSTASAVVKPKKEEAEPDNKHISQSVKSTLNVQDNKGDVVKKEQETKGSVLGFFGGGKAKQKSTVKSELGEESKKDVCDYNI